MADRGEYRAIYTALLDDADFQALSAPARLCFLVLKIQLGPSGIGVAYDAVTSQRSGLSVPKMRAAFAELEAGNWAEREGNVIWIRNALRYEPNLTLTNTNHRSGIQKHLRSLPRLAIVNRMAGYYGLSPAFDDGSSIPSPIPSPSHADGIPHPIPIRERERERERDTEKKAPSGPKKAASRRCPSGWQPNASHKELALQLRVDFALELDKFRDYEFAKPRTDWDASFRNWLRSAKPNGKHPPVETPPLVRNSI